MGAFRKLLRAGARCLNEASKLLRAQRRALKKGPPTTTPPPPAPAAKTREHGGGEEVFQPLLDKNKELSEAYGQLEKEIELENAAAARRRQQEFAAAQQGIAPAPPEPARPIEHPAAAATPGQDPEFRVTPGTAPASRGPHVAAMIRTAGEPPAETPRANDEAPAEPPGEAPNP